MKWRSVDRLWRMKFFHELKARVTERLLFGAEEYGDTFQGDPLEHATEEALDLMFYLQVLRSQREELCDECRKKLQLD